MNMKPIHIFLALFFSASACDFAPGPIGHTTADPSISGGEGSETGEDDSDGSESGGSVSSTGPEYCPGGEGGETGYSGASCEYAYGCAENSFSIICADGMCSCRMDGVPSGECELTTQCDDSAESPAVFREDIAACCGWAAQ